MHPISLQRWLAALLVLAAGAAFAQGKAPTGVETPAQPAGSGGITFQSALQDYQPFSDEKPVPWKEANETVRQIGGWRAYAKEAASSAAPQDGKADPHGAHHAPQPKAKP